MERHELVQLDLPHFFYWVNNNIDPIEGDFTISISDNHSIDTILEDQEGTIIDFIELEKFYCENKHISFKTYLVELQDKPRTSHFILVCDNKIIGKYFYIECFEKEIAGIYETKNIESIFNFVAKYLKGKREKYYKYKVYKYVNLLSVNKKMVGITRTPYKNNEKPKKSKLKKIL